MRSGAVAVRVQATSVGVRPALRAVEDWEKIYWQAAMQAP